MLDPVSLDTTQPDLEPPLASLDVGASAVAPLEGVAAAQRAFKAKFGLPGLNKSYDEILKDLEDGRERPLREYASSMVNFQNEGIKQEAISQLINKHNIPAQQALDYVNNAMKGKTETDPYSVFEEYYSKEFLDNLQKTGDINDTSWWKNTPAAIKQQLFEQSSEVETKRQLLMTRIEDGEALIKQQSNLGYIADIGKGLIPGYSNIKQGIYTNFLGEGLEQEANKRFGQPLPEFKAWLDSLDKLRDDNPGLYVSHLKAMLGQSTGERVLNNVITAIDASMIKPGAIVAGGKGISNLIRDANYVRSAYKSAIKSAEEPITKAAIEEAAGNVPEATVQAVTAKVVANAKGAVNPIQDAAEALQNVFKVSAEKVTAEPGTFRQEFINRITERYQELQDKLLTVLQTSARVERLPAILKVEEAVRAVVKNLGEEYPGLKNTLMNMSRPVREPISNTYTVDAYIGNGKGLFTNIKDAQTFANTHGLKGAIVSEETQKGTGYYIKISKPLRETDSVVRDFLLATNEAKTPESVLNAWGGWLGKYRTPEETLALEQRLNRKIATFAPSNLFKIAKETSEEIKALRGWNLPGTKTREKWLGWQRVMSEAKEDARVNGKLFDSPLEVTNLYKRVLQRLPDEQEVAASFALKRQEETLDVLRNIQAYRNKARIGAETFDIRVPDLAAGTDKTHPFRKFTVDGVAQKEWPKTEDTVLAFGNDVGKERLFLSSKRDKLIEKLMDDVKEGRRKLIRVINPEDRPFASLDNVRDSRVRYVISDRVDTKPLSWNQFQNRLHEYDYDHYVKQAQVKLDNYSKFHWYEGDSTIAAFNIRAIGRDFAEKLENVRLHLKGDNVGAAKAYLEEKGFPKAFDEVHNWFKPTLDENDRWIAPRLNLDEPIQVVPRNRLIGDLDNNLRNRYGESFKDGTREGYGRLYDPKPDPYEVFTAKNSGSKANPLYNIEPVKYLDPVTSINRALTKAINSTWMDDYKIFSVEHWIQEAKGLLNATDAEIREAPFYWFFNGQFKHTDTVKVNNLEVARFQIKQFLGVENKTTTFLHDLSQRVADSIYERFGESKLAIAPTWLLPSLRDPFSFMRSVTFHAKLGLFAIPQLMVQAQTYSVILGVAGYEYAAPGAKAALFHMLTGYNSSPEIMSHLDKLMTKQLLPGTAKWKPGEFIEANKLLTQTGFGNVAGEHILRDNPWKHDVISSKGSEFLDWGSFFFREGERNVRMGAFYTAYREFRGANPLINVGDAELKSILNRADTLSVNMSRASASALHEGVFSIPTQFLSYQLRLGELFLGKRLTETERARLFGVFGALYGVPGAFGLTGIPLGDYINKWSKEDGYVVGNNWLNTTVSEGIPSMLLGLTTGNFYNVQERYGAQGFQPFRDAMRSDKTAWDLLGGAAFSTFSGAISRTDGFWAAMMSMVRGDGKFSLKLDDFIDPFKEISSVNNTWRLLAAINTGKWLSKKEAYLTDASMGNAIFSYISGLQPQTASDINTMTWTRQTEKDIMKHAEEQYIREYHRGLQAMDNNNPSQAADFFKRGMVYLVQSGYPEEDIMKLRARAVKDYEAIAGNVTWDYFTKNVLETRKPAAQQALPQALQQQNRNK